MGRRFLFILSGLFAFTSLALAQGSSCPPPRVGVVGEIVDEEDFVRFLQERYPHRSPESLLGEIRATILENLRKGSPRVIFLENGTDCEYQFSYSLSLTASGEDKDIGGILMGESTAFFMTSKLVQRNACGFPGWVLNVKTQEAPDVFEAISKNIASYGALEALIEDFERTHRVPPRGPKMTFELRKDFVSPVPGEESMDIRIRVTNCRGEPVFDERHGQVVILPRKTERGEIAPTRGFPQDFVVTEHAVMLQITHEAGGSVTYTLKRGLDMDLETFHLATCGIDTVLVEDLLPPVPIAGVSLEVLPEEPYVSPQETTTVTIALSRILPSGAKLPIARAPVTIEVAGLVDGSFAPQGSGETDSRGEVRCTYRAGEKEDHLIIKAHYRPGNFPDTLSAESGIAVVDAPRCFRGRVAFAVEFNHEESEKASFPGGGKKASRYEMTLQASVQGELIARPGKPEELLSKSFSGTQRLYLFAFSEAGSTPCRREGVKGEVQVQPGSSESSETTFAMTLREKDLKISANIEVDRHTGTYRCSLGFSGLVFTGTSKTYERFYDACTGETRENTFVSPEIEEDFSFFTGEFQGVTTDLNHISGERVFEPYVLGKGRVRCTFDFVRIPCEPSED